MCRGILFAEKVQAESDEIFHGDYPLSKRLYSIQPLPKKRSWILMPPQDSKGFVLDGFLYGYRRACI